MLRFRSERTRAETAGSSSCSQSKSKHEQSSPNRRVFVPCPSASKQYFTASQAGGTLLSASTWQLVFTYISLTCVALVLTLVHLQNPLTSRATVVDCSDRQSGAATPLPKPAPIPEPKLKPDVRPGKVSHHLLRQQWKTTQHQQHIDDQCAVNRKQLADTTRKGLQSDGLDASYKITPRLSRQAWKS